MQTIRITTSQNIDIDYELASIGHRALGYLVDAVLLGFVWLLLVLGNMIFGGGIGSDRLLIAGLVFFALLVGLYDLLFEIFMNGRSPGKLVMKIRVISLDGARPTAGQFAIRWLLRLVDFTLVSGLVAFISTLLSDKSQRLGDIAAGTVVVRTVPKVSSSEVPFTFTAPDYIPVFAEASRLSDEDIRIINEVMFQGAKSGNYPLIHEMANKVKAHLGITTEMQDYPFLSTIVKDYTHLLAEHSA